jgi:hypothetical protein
VTRRVSARRTTDVLLRQGVSPEVVVVRVDGVEVLRLTSREAELLLRDLRSCGLEKEVNE